MGLGKIVVENNPCSLEVMFDFGEYAFSSILGENWRKYSEDVLEKKIALANKMLGKTPIDILFSLKQDNVISDYNKIIYVLKIVVPEEFTNMGYEDDFFNSYSKSFLNGNEYFLLMAENRFEKEFVRRNNWKCLRDNYFGKEIIQDRSALNEFFNLSKN